MKVVLDTNVILDSPEILLREDFEIIIPYLVIKELDGLKANYELRPVVQTAFKSIVKLYKKNKIKIIGIPTEFSTNDEKIVVSAKNEQASILTNDIGATIVAYANGVSVYEEEDLEDDNVLSYNGVKEINIHDNSIIHLVGKNELTAEEAENYFETTLSLNEYVYYAVPNKINEYAIWKKNNDSKVRLVKQGLKSYMSNNIYIVPQDAPQQCVLDAVMDDTTPLTIIDGRLGTGKTLLGLCASLNKVMSSKGNSYRKVYVTRPPIPVDKKLQLGFLPGTLEEKISPWLVGIKSNLKFIFERTLKDVENEEAEKIYTSYIEPINLESIQGMNIHNSILIVDEYQLLSVDMLKQVLSRVAEGSKVILLGDPEGQTYGQNRGVEGFRKLKPYIKGTKQISYIKLDKIYRSELAEFIDKVFK